MKNLLLCLFGLVTFTARGQGKPDTIPVKEGFVKVKYKKNGHYFKEKCDYIIKLDGQYYVNGRPLGFIRYDSTRRQRH